MNQGIGHCGQVRGVDPGTRSGRGDGGTREKTTHRPRVGTFGCSLGLQHRLGQGKCNRALTARLGGNPLIRGRGGEVQASAKGNHSRAAGFMCFHIPAIGVLARVLRGREPRGKEIRTQVNDEVRLTGIEERQRSDSENSLGPLAQGFVSEGFVDHALRIRRRGESVDHSVEGRAPAFAENPCPAAGRVQTRRDFRGGLLPSGRLQFTTRAPHPGFGIAIREVGPAQAGLAPGTKLATIDGMVGVAFELDGAAFTGLHMKSTSSGTLSARGRVPHRDARRDRFGLLHIGNELFYWI